MSVKVQELTKVYGEQRAVDAISFEIGSGQIVGFLGPNGAGKSTTMKMLTGYIAPTSGHGEVSGYDIEEQSLEVRKRTGYLPEHNPLYLEMYVREYLHFVGGVTHYKGNVTERIEQLIEQTGLGLEQKKKIGMLSKGYRQRIGLAQAMFHNPEVLILDEPTSGLDPNQIVDIRNLIRELGKEKTVILSTHIMQEVQALCNRVIIIHRGKIVADGTTAELTGSLGDRSVIRVAFKNPVSAENLKKIKGIERLENQGSYWLLYSTGKTDFREQVFHWAVENGNVIYELSRESLSLEDVFQQLTVGKNN